MKTLMAIAMLCGCVGLAPAAKKREQLSPPTCIYNICFTEMGWNAWNFSNIHGVLVNGSTLTLKNLVVTFTLKSSDGATTGTAIDVLNADLPAGGRWRFIAHCSSGEVSDSVTFQGTVERDGKLVRFEESLSIGPYRKKL